MRIALAADNAGYLLKNAEPEEIIEAIGTVYHKGFYFNEHLSVTLIKQLVGPGQADAGQQNIELNDREVEVLKLVCQEYSNQEIADKIFLSVRTVEGYRARLFEKTGSKNLVGLVIFAIKRGIISVFHYLPLHLSEMGGKFGGRQGDCPVTERVSDQLIRLPFHNALTSSDVELVIENIQEFEF